MDVLTQGVMGRALASSAAKAGQARLAAVTGFAAALLADADVLISSTEDTLVQLEYHRHFSHSLIFIPIGALVAAVLLWPLLRKRLGFGRIYFYALLGYATSGLLDACTSYGTHLLWPFSEARIAWSIIAIVDPLFTLILLVAAIWSMKVVRPGPARVGLGLAGAYLLLGVWQHQQALSAAERLAETRGHEIDQIIVKPTIANLVLWRSVYESGGIFHVDAIRLGLMRPNRIYPGSSVARFDAARDRPDIESGTVLARDIDRFSRLSDGFVADDPDKIDVLIDVRYSMLPSSLAPMWGIDIDPADPTRHARFRIYRQRPDDLEQSFIAMLLGRDLPVPP